MNRFSILALCLVANLAVTPAFAEEGQADPTPAPTAEGTPAPAPAPAGDAEPECN